MRRTSVFKSIQERIVQRRSRAWLSANTALVMLFWDIGHSIRLREKAGTDPDVVDTVSRRLAEFHPKSLIFSRRNVDYMRRFAAAFPDRRAAKRQYGHLPWRKVMETLDGWAADCPDRGSGV